MIALNQHYRPLFSLGRIVATPGAIAALERSGKQPGDFLRRHVSGDWGDVCAGDKQLNDVSVKDGTRILSSYEITADEKIWVITEADRSATTLLLPDEY